MKQSKYVLFCALGALLSSGAISIITSMKTSNVITGVLAVILYWFYKKQRPESKQEIRIMKTAIAVGGFLSIFMLLKGLESFDRYPSIGGIGKISILFCVLSGYFILFSYFIYFVYLIMLKIDIKSKNTQERKFSYKIFFIVFGVILLSWLPYYLSYYPGILISDSWDQISQALSGIYSNHHPVVHTWIIQGVLMAGMQIFGNLSPAIALYCILQMIILALIYAYVISIFNEYHIKLWICIVITAFYALMPYNVMFSFNMWKDSLFSAFVLLFTVILWKTIINREQQQIKVSVRDSILYVLAGLGICLFRNNGFYAFLLVLPFICVICWKNKRYLVVSTICILLITVFIKGPVFSYFKVASPDMIESLSIPAQQIARVVSDEGELSEEQRALLGKIMEMDKIADAYNPRISDPIKGLVRSYGNQEYLEQNKFQYLNLWINLGVKYPSQYLRAYMNQTEGYWNPDVQYWVYVGEISENQAGIHSEPLLPTGVTRLLKGLFWDNYQDIPIYGIFWSIGAAVWISFGLAGFCYFKNKTRELSIFLPMLALWGTIMIATPVYAEFRYIYAIFLCLPLFIVAALYEEGNYEEEVMAV